MEARLGLVTLLYSLTGLVFVGIGIPLAMQRIAPNAWYGFRTPKTLASKEVWYAANRVAGFDLIIGGVAIVCGMLLLYVLRERVTRILPFPVSSLILFCGTMLAVVGHGFWSLSRM